MYSPVSFLRRHAEALESFEARALAQAIADGEVRVSGTPPQVFYRNLAWDSRHFGLPVYRVDFASLPDEPAGAPAPSSLAQAYRALDMQLRQAHERFYLFAEVPSEDVVALQAMGLAGMRLVETRLTYYYDEVEHYDSEPRHPSRRAVAADIPNLRDVAQRARNPFDRYHADSFFPPATADEYIATYAENCVRGFADMVIVPAPDSDPPGAFLAGAFDERNSQACGTKVARIALTAVATERRGWNRKLNSEFLYWFKERGVGVVYTTTQATNRAAIRVLESLRYAYGRATHVFAASVGNLPEGDGNGH